MTSITIFYYPEENLFKDSKDRVLINMYKIIPPWKVYLFKYHKKNDEYINYEYGIIVKILYPN
jgi:hypothetical protein